ncbi:MAG: HEAT repeat domain-containing protein [Ignavibacteriaceae bacterium]
MKLCNFLLGIFFVLLFCFNSIYPQDSIKVIKKISDESVDLNYLEGVKAENIGLKISSSYYLGERKSRKAVIPLMSILKSDKSPEARVMAALSLFKIGDERGIFAIKQAVKFDDNEWVKKMCNIFYQMYITNNEAEK